MDMATGGAVIGFTPACRCRHQRAFFFARDFEAACLSKEKLLREEITILRKENRILKAQVAQKDVELKLKNKRILELESKK